MQAGRDSLFFMHLKNLHPALRASDRVEVRAHYDLVKNKEDVEEEATMQLKYKW
jgi:hypothetical protein